MVKPEGYYTDKNGKVRPITGRKPHVNPLSKGTMNIRIPKRTIRKVQAKRSTHAKRIDDSLKAKIPENPEEWVNEPNRNDLVGVDYPEGKHKIVKVLLHRAEGSRKDPTVGKTMEFKSIEATNQQLRKNTRSMPEEQLGYDKHDFTIVWSDGTAYKGRYDLRRDETNPNIEKHVKDEAKFWNSKKAEKIGYSKKDVDSVRAEYKKYLKLLKSNPDGYPYRSRKKMTYHGRTGYPMIHITRTSGRKYIMVRKKGGGTKRLYLDKHGNVPERHRK